MYTNKLLSAIPALLIALSTLTLNVEAQLKQQYPPVDKPPPPVAAWTALVDQTKVPKAPLRPVGSACDPVDPFCVWSCTTCTRPASDFVSCPKKTEWALTYDDGPTINTLRVLEALDARGLKGTFFVVGSRVFENPQILKQLVASGHQVGIHTWSHTPLTSQTNEQIIAEAKWTEMAIKEAVNLTPKWFRAPQGDCDDRVRAILTQLGYKIAFWDRDTFDWKSNADPTYDLNWIPGNFTEWVKNTTSPTGFISLEHDAFDRPSSMASKAMDIVIGANFVPESMSVCLGDEQPYVEATKLPRSALKNNQTASNAPGAPGAADPTASRPPVISQNGASSNVQLSVVFGFIMMIFGFVGTVYA